MSDRQAIVVKHIIIPGYEQARSVVLAEEQVTIQQFLDRQGWKFRLPTILIINGAPVLRASWATTVISRSDVVCFMSRPWGGGAGSSSGSKTNSIIGIVALIALTAFAAWAAPLVAGALGISSALGIQLISAGIVLGGSLLLSTFIFPKAGSGNNQPVDQLFSLSAGGNVARPLGTVPVQYGRLKTFPNYAATPYSDYQGEFQFLNLLLCLGAGKFDIEQVLIDTTILAAKNPADFGGVSGGSWPLFNPDNIKGNKDWQVQFLVSNTSGDANINPAFVGVQIRYYEPGSNVDLFPLNVFQAPDVSGQDFPDPTRTFTVNDWLGGFIANPSGSLAYHIAIDIAFPAGLYVQNNAGALYGASVGIVVQAQPVNEAGEPLGPYGDLINQTISLTTRQPTRMTLGADVGPGRYQIRVQRTSVPSQFLAQPDGAGNTTVNDVVWLGLRAFLQGPTSFKDVSVLAIRLLATAQLSSASAKQIGVIATRVLPVWDVPTQTMIEKPTRSPAWAFYDAATNVVYGANRPVSKVDFQGIIDLDAGATARGDTCNISFASAVAVPQAFDSILLSTRAKHRWAGDILTFVRDELVPVPQMLLTDQQIVRGSITFNYIFNDDITQDSVILEYLDEVTWKPAEAQYPPNGTPAGFVSTLPSRIRADAITNRQQAKREAAFFYLQAFYRRIKITLDTEHEGRLLNLGSVIRIQSELPQSWGSTGVVTAVVFDGVSWEVTLSPAPDWSVQGTHFINLREKTGKLFGPISCSQGGTTNIAVLSNADLATVQTQTGTTLARCLERLDGAEQPSYDFGVGTAVSRKCIVLSGTPRGENVTLNLVADNDLVHTTDLADIPPLPAQDPRLNPPVPIIAGLIANFDQGVIEPTLRATWWPSSGAAYYDAQVSYDGGKNWVEIYSGTAPGFTKIVENAALILRVAGIGNAHGAWVQLSLAAPIIVLDTPTVGLNGLIAGLSQAVKDSFASVQNQIKGYEQLISAAASEADSASYVRDYNVKVLASAQYGTLNASVTQTAIALAGPNGSLAAYFLTLDVNGYVSGLRAYNSGVSSSIVLITDNFLVASPSVLGANPVPMFSISNVSGTPQITIQGNLIADGTIVARTLAVGAINAGNIIVDNIIVTGHLTADAATSLNSAVGVGFNYPPSTPSKIVVTLNFTAVVGRVSIDASVEVQSPFYTGNRGAFQGQILIDGIVQRTFTFFSTMVATGSPSNTWVFSECFSMPFQTTVSVGPHTFALQLLDTTALLGGLNTTAISTPSIRVFESRR